MISALKNTSISRHFVGDTVGGKINENGMKNEIHESVKLLKDEKLGDTEEVLIIW
jgi:hypothetical protein